ncbi:unnamed protein product [Closterium sp. Naga37s-1]|nr:unnamed protein product [Closterium sp. Naga37s-1]
MSFVMPVPSSASEGSAAAGDWGFSGPVKGFPSAQTAPLSTLDVAAPAEQSPAQGEQWEALYASVQDAVLMYNAQFVSALADGFPPAADVIASLDEALQDLAKDVYVAMDKMEEGVSQRASLFPIRVFAMCASLEVSRCRRLFPKLQEEEEEEEGQQQQKSDHYVAGEVSGEGVSKDAPGVSTEVSGELKGWSFLAAAGNLRDQPVSAALPPLDEDDLTVLEQLLEEAGDEIQGLFLNCKGSLYGLGVTHARSLARFSILGKALKAAIEGATEASFTVLRDGREEVRYLERREAGEKEGGERKEEGEGRGVGASGRGSGFEFDTSKVSSGCSQSNEGEKERRISGGEEEEEEEDDEDDDDNSDTNESDNIEDDCIIWDDGLQDIRALFAPKQSVTTPSGKSPSASSTSSTPSAAALTPQGRPEATSPVFSNQNQQKQQHLRTQSEVILDSTQKSPRAANSIFSDRQQQNHQRAFSVAVTPNLSSDSSNLTADSKTCAPGAPTEAAASIPGTPKGPRLGARILLERIRDYQWLAEWLGIDPDELLIHKVLSVVPVGMLLTDLGVPRSLESGLLESQRPLLLRVVLPGFREEVKRRLLGAGLAWTEGMLVKTVVFEPKRNAAVFTTGGGSAAASGGASGSAADAAGAGGGGGEAGAATGAAAAAAAAGGKGLAKKPSHNRTKSAEDMQELSPFVSHAVQESLTAGGGLAKQIPLEDILAATDSWSPERKLGEGAYGTVFKGVVGRGGEGGDGELWAVKRAGNVSGSHLEEFEKEVSWIRLGRAGLGWVGLDWAGCSFIRLSQIPLEDILAATDSWSPERKLGEGAYGTVFKGVVGRGGEGGDGEIWAVKRAGNVSGSHLEEFEKELGEGAYGTVFKGVVGRGGEGGDGEIWAVKRAGNESESHLEEFEKEDILAASDSWSPERKLGEGANGTVFKGVVGRGGEGGNGEIWAVKRAGNVSGSHLEEFEKEIPLKDILAATDSWSPERKLGEGAYGTVFKGIVGRGGGSEGGEIWAVKRAGNVSGSFLEEFEKEVSFMSRMAHQHLVRLTGSTSPVSFMSRMAHQHLVRLIGFWADCDERILIYEFMHNGTLASRIHRAVVPASPTGEAPKKAPPPPLTFDERVAISVGAAEGLHYLHDFARPPVIHRDIKSENILLAADLQAKAIPLITAGKLKSVVDPALENNYPPGGMKAFANVAVMCVQKSAAQRPTMAEVATRLSAIQHKVQDLHIQGEEPKYNFQPTIGTGAPPGAAAAAAAAPIPRAQSAPRPKSPAPKVPQKKAGEKSGSGAGAKAKAKDAGVGEGKETKGKKAGGKGVTRAKTEGRLITMTVETEVISQAASPSSNYTATMTRDTPFYYVWPATEPLVQTFEWKVDETPVSNLPLMLCTCIGYVAFILGLKWYRTKNKMAPVNLGFLPAIHNLILCLWSLAMFLGTIHAMLLDSEINKYDTGMGKYTWLLCFPSTVKPVGYLWFWSYIYYLSKYYELLDTVILVLKNKPLSFLHVYHHATIVFLCWLWLTNTQSLQVIAITINTGIHVMMYFYYFMHSFPPAYSFHSSSLPLSFPFPVFLLALFLFPPLVHFPLRPLFPTFSSPHVLFSRSLIPSFSSPVLLSPRSLLPVLFSPRFLLPSFFSPRSHLLSFSSPLVLFPLALFPVLFPLSLSSPFSSPSFSVSFVLLPPSSSPFLIPPLLIPPLLIPSPLFNHLLFHPLTFHILSPFFPIPKPFPSCSSSYRFLTIYLALLKPLPASLFSPLPALDLHLVFSCTPA